MAFDTVGRAIALGLLSVKAPEGTQAAYLFPASDFDEIFSSILNLDWKRSVRESRIYQQNLKKYFFPME